MFQGMLEGLKEESVGFLFNLQVEATPAPAGPAASAGLAVAPGLASPVAAGAPTGAPAATTARPTPTAPPAAPAPPAPAVPSALRAKGLEDRDEQRLTFSGPAEDGGTAVRRSGSATAGQSAADGTRRERREAARAQSKGPKKAARSKRKK